MIYFMLLHLLQHSARAQYHSFNTASGSDAIVQEYRSPNIPPGIYDAIHENYVNSSDGGSGYFYGGMTHQNGSKGTLIQYVCWPATGGFAPYSQQIPIFAGAHMVGYAQIGEGSSCAIKGYWPQFSTNLWTRFVVRYWQPSDGTSHVGYQGMWMKEPVTGRWYHLGTFLYPFAVTGVNGMSGWQENYSGYQGTYVVEHRGGYYHKNGVWQRANQISFTAAGHCTLIDNNTAARSEVANSALANNVPLTLTLSGQPASPTFDPILVENPSALSFGSQLLVRWDIPETSAPQLAYTIEVFPDANYAGSPAMTITEKEPEIRQKLLTLVGLPTPHVRLTISDIFFRTSQPILLAPATATLVPALEVPNRVPGLNYQYYHAPSGDWFQLPDFSALTPIRQGSVGFPDPTPRLRRLNYGFTYSGYFTAPTDGIYSFKLHSGDGSRLLIDNQTAIDFDGVHDSSQFKSGAMALAAGPHAFALQYFQGAANPVNTEAFTDGLGLACEGPGLSLSDIPPSAFSRLAKVGEPSVTLVANNGAAPVLNTNPDLQANVVANGTTTTEVQFLFTDYFSYYQRPSRGTDYILGRRSLAPFTLTNLVWAATTNLVRARLVYNGTQTVDSVPLSLVTTNAALTPWIWTPLEMHNYPSGAAVQAGSLLLLGDGMNFLSRKVTGDCTVIARLSDITAATDTVEGITPDRDWRAGLILRANTNATLGEPLGNGSVRFAALFSTVGGGTYFQDDTMRAGNGDANRWSGNLGAANRWYKLQRAGSTITSSVSADGTSWTVVNTITLSGLPPSLYAGVFAHAVQSFNPHVHKATLDSFSLLSAGVVGPTSVSIHPATQETVRGLPVSFNASVVGPSPIRYQWQLNGVELPGANQASLVIPNVTSAHLGNYTVVANSVTSAPAALSLRMPTGSGVWTNPNGGSWATASNWTNSTPAAGVDSLADFGALSMTANRTVTLDGPRTVGTLLFEDLNSSTPHGWTVNSGAAGPLTLSTSAGVPAVAVLNATSVISAAVAGNQGFIKVGPGGLLLSGASSFSGPVQVRGGTLEVQSKNGDVPYQLAAGATLKIGYSTGGGYANTGLTLQGGGVDSSAGLYLLGGRNYNASGQIALLGAPTTMRGYGSGFANLGTFDINGDGLWCSAAASGSALATNIQLVSQGYGMSMKVDAGVSTLTGDLLVQGPLNVGNLGFYKRGQGSVRLLSPAGTGNKAINLQGGVLLCAAEQCLGTNATLSTSAGTTLDLGTTSQIVTTATLAGQLRISLQKDVPPSSGRLICRSGALNCGGTLLVSLTAGALAANDEFTLFNAPTYTGQFASIQLPTLHAPFSWDTSQLLTQGKLRVAAPVSTNLNWSVRQNTLQLSWPAGYLGWILQTQTNPLSIGLNSNWWDVPGSAAVLSTNLLVDPSGPAVFYRLRSVAP